MSENKKWMKVRKASKNKTKFFFELENEDFKGIKFVVAIPAKFIVAIAKGTKKMEKKDE